MILTPQLSLFFYEIAIMSLPRVRRRDNGVVGVVMDFERIDGDESGQYLIHWGVQDRQVFETWVDCEEVEHVGDQPHKINFYREWKTNDKSPIQQFVEGEIREVLKEEFDRAILRGKTGYTLDPKGLRTYDLTSPLPPSVDSVNKIIEDAYPVMEVSPLQNIIRNVRRRFGV